MFDASYFRESLAKQTKDVGGNPVVRVVLRGGQEYLVRDVVETKPGFVLLNVHPAEVTGHIVAPSTSAYSMIPETGFHPVAVAYESIAHVYLSTTTAEERPRIGFYP